MDWDDFCSIPYGISSGSWPTGDMSRSINLDENPLLDNCMISDKPTLAGFAGDPGIYSSYEFDLESIGINSSTVDPSLDGGHRRYSSHEQSYPSGSDILFNKNIASKLKEIDLIRIRDAYGIPASVKLRLPQLRKRVSWNVPGWTFFYELPFKDGFRFPIPPVVGMVLEYFEIAPSQLMRNSWRLLLALQVLSNQHDIPFGMLELLYGYFIREHDGEKGRFSLNARKNVDRLIVDLSSGDKGWKGYFFLASDDLVRSENYRCPSAWSRGLRINLQLVEGLFIREPISKILAIPKDQRDCQFLLSRKILSSIGLWKHTSAEPRGILSNFPRNEIPIIMAKRGMEILGCDLILTSLLDSTEREIANYIMSRVIGSLFDTLERRKVKEKSTKISSYIVLADMPIPSNGNSSQTEQPDTPSPSIQKRSHPGPMVADNDSIVLTFPSDSSIFSNPRVVALGEGLLFPEDRTCYEQLGPIKATENTMAQLFQGLQGAIFQKNEAIRQARNVRSLQDANTSLRGEVESLKARKNEADLAARKALDELAEIVHEKLLLEGELTNLKRTSGEQVASLEDRLENCQLEVEIATRDILMNDYKKGKHVDWDVDNAITDYAELCQMLGMSDVIEEPPEFEVVSSERVENVDDGQY